MAKSKSAKKQKGDKSENEISIQAVSGPHSSINKLPDEIFELVLHHVGTVQNVVRFRAVCKCWRDMIPSTGMVSRGMDLGYLLLDSRKSLLALHDLVKEGLGRYDRSKALKIALVSLRDRSHYGKPRSLATIRDQLNKIYLSNGVDQYVTVRALESVALDRFAKSSVKAGSLAKQWKELTASYLSEYPWTYYGVPNGELSPVNNPLFAVGTTDYHLSIKTVVSRLCRRETLHLDVGQRDVMMFLFFLSKASNPVRTLQLSCLSVKPQSYAKSLEGPDKIVLRNIVTLEVENVQLNDGRLRARPQIQIPNLRTLRVRKGPADVVLLYSVAKVLDVLELPSGHKTNTRILKTILRLSNLKKLVIDQDLLGFSEVISTCDASGRLPCPLLEELTFYNKRNAPVKADLTMVNLLSRLVEAFSRRIRMRPLHSKHTEQKAQRTKAAVHLRKLDTPIYAQEWEIKDWNKSFEHFLVLFPNLSGPVRDWAKDKNTARLFDKKCSAIADKEIKDYFESI